jgi:hypothetical protein
MGPSRWTRWSIDVTKTFVVRKCFAGSWVAFELESVTLFAVGPPNYSPVVAQKQTASGAPELERF